jgi:DNA-binding MarR family transcriptional regulator
MGRTLAAAVVRTEGDDSPWQELREANFLLRARGTRALGRFDLSVPEFVVLQLCGRGPARASEVARSLGLTAQGTTDVLDRLEKRGFVQRAPDPADRRAVQITLTRAGRRLEEEARSAKESMLRYLEHNMSRGERQALAEGLRALTRALREAPAPEV